MTAIETLKTMELGMDELDQAAGGVNRYKALNAKEGFIIYKVKAGDTLNKIARTYGCTVRELMAWNPKVTDKSMIYINEYLYIRA